MTIEEGVKPAQQFENPVIIPAYFEGRKHFTGSRAGIEAAFSHADLLHRLKRAQ